LYEKPHGMSSWYIDLDGHEEYLLSPESVEMVSNGPGTSIIRVKYKYNESSFSQDIILQEGVQRVDFQFNADWKEIGTSKKEFPMVKVAFPVNVENGKARFETPFGNVIRPADGHEAPALKWIDLSGSDYGVSLLNDCKYGHDIKGNVLRLTLLRCSYDPDPKPDLGIHQANYSLYPHSGGWVEADTVKRGYELNNLLIPVPGINHKGKLPKAFSFARVEPSNLIVTGFKKAEKSDDLILRFYESKGVGGTASISLGKGIKAVCETNLMEEPIANSSIPVQNGHIKVPFGKWEIKTLRVTPIK